MRLFTIGQEMLEDAIRDGVLMYIYRDIRLGGSFLVSPSAVPVWYAKLAFIIKPKTKTT
jgi:hypothetical protein